MNTQQPTTEVSTDAGLDLKLDVATVRQELALIAPDSISAETTEDAELEDKARQFADALIDPDSSDFEAQDEMKAAVDDMVVGHRQDIEAGLLEHVQIVCLRHQ